VPEDADFASGMQKRQAEITARHASDQRSTGKAGQARMKEFGSPLAGLSAACWCRCPITCFALFATCVGPLCRCLPYTLTEVLRLDQIAASKPSVSTAPSHSAYFITEQPFVPVIAS